MKLPVRRDVPSSGLVVLRITDYGIVVCALTSWACGDLLTATISMSMYMRRAAATEVGALMILPPPEYGVNTKGIVNFPF